MSGLGVFDCGCGMGWGTDVDVAVDDFPGGGARYFDAVDRCCCCGHFGRWVVGVWVLGGVYFTSCSFKRCVFKRRVV